MLLFPVEILGDVWFVTRDTGVVFRHVNTMTIPQLINLFFCPNVEKRRLQTNILVKEKEKAC